MSNQKVKLPPCPSGFQFRLQPNKGQDTSTCLVFRVSLKYLLTQQTNHNKWVYVKFLTKWYYIVSVSALTSALKRRWGSNTSWLQYPRNAFYIFVPFHRWRLRPSLRSCTYAIMVFVLNLVRNPITELFQLLFGMGVLGSLNSLSRC